MVNPDSCFLKIILITFVNINKFLRISVDQWEPAALYLYHKLMTFLEFVCYIRDTETNFCYFTRDKWFRILKAVPVLASHHFPSDEHLVATQRYLNIGISRWDYLVGENINDLNNKIGIGSGS